MSNLQREVEQLSAKLDEQHELLQSREKQVATLKSAQQLLLGRCSERMKVSCSSPSPSLFPPSLRPLEYGR